MKISAKGHPYFNAMIQEAGQVTRLVAYGEKQRTDLAEFEN